MAALGRERLTAMWWRQKWHVYGTPHHCGFLSQRWWFTFSKSTASTLLNWCWKVVCRSLLWLKISSSWVWFTVFFSLLLFIYTFPSLFTDYSCQEFLCISLIFLKAYFWFYFAFFPSVSICQTLPNILFPLMQESHLKMPHYWGSRNKISIRIWVWVLLWVNRDCGKRQQKTTSLSSAAFS